MNTQMLLVRVARGYGQEEAEEGAERAHMKVAS